MTLFDVVSAVIEVTEDEHEAVAVVVHMLESGRVKLPPNPKRASEPGAALRRTG